MTRHALGIMGTVAIATALAITGCARNRNDDRSSSPNDGTMDDGNTQPVSEPNDPLAPPTGTSPDDGQPGTSPDDTMQPDDTQDDEMSPGGSQGGSAPGTGAPGGGGTPR